MLERAGAARPDYELVAFKEAGLPVWVTTVRFMLLERKALGPIEEAALSAIKVGLDKPEDVRRFLGLPKSVLDSVFATLYGGELINYVVIEGAAAQLSLTSKGKSVLAEAATIVPRERIAKVCIDGLTGRLLPIAPESLFRASEARDIGLFEVPMGVIKRPTADAIPIEDFDKLLARQRVDDELPAELLSIRRVDRAELQFMKCLMLFYRNRADADEVDVGFWREDGPSLEHEASFRRIGGADLVGARLIAKPDAAESAGNAGTTDEPIVEENPTMQTLLCHEHPALLKKALCLSQKRFMVVSPWIRHQVVDAEFVRNLEALLKKGVETYIGYGLDKEAGGQADPGRSKPPITPQAEAFLKPLAAKYKNFHLIYVGNTHRKLLVSDDSFAVSTSFNWLSFRGDPKQPPRDEQGVMIRKRKYVEEQFQSGLKLLHSGYEGAAR